MKDIEPAPTDERPRPGRVDDGPPEPGRDPAVSGLDAFWPALAVVLAVAVVFVASVAHNSMDSVGTVNSLGAPLPKPSPSVTSTAPAATITIVQVSSHPSQAAARVALRRLLEQGLPGQVLDSDDYQPMNPGYYVVYAGPYPSTPAGRAEAARVRDRLAGSIIREVRSRTP